LPDSTSSPSPDRRLGRTRAAAWLCAAIAAALLAPPAALADGDPASDVLATQTVYAPSDGGFAPSQTARLSALLAEAQRAGVPIRVALIPTQADLGSVTELWRQPQNYARFLGQELAQVYRGTVLIEMPNGEGVYRPPAQAPGVSPIAVGEPTSMPLISVAMSTVDELAQNAGHRLPLPRALASPGSGSALGSVDLGSWLALAAGAVLIVAAWTASLRTRPPARLRWPR
jgi:hypothetical protein